MRAAPGQVREVEAPGIEDQGGQVDHVAARQGEAGGSASVRGGMGRARADEGKGALRMQEEHLRGRTASRMGQRRAGSPKPFCSLIGTPNKSSHLFGFDDRQVQFNFTSDLETSTFSSCRKQRKLDKRGVLLRKRSPFSRN